MARLTEYKLLQYGKQLTKMRMSIRQKASQLLEEDQVNKELKASSISNMSRKMEKGYFSRKALQDVEYSDDGEDTPIMHR